MCAKKHKSRTALKALVHAQKQIPSLFSHGDPPRAMRSSPSLPFLSISPSAFVGCLGGGGLCSGNTSRTFFCLLRVVVFCGSCAMCGGFCWRGTFGQSECSFSGRVPPHPTVVPRADKQTNRQADKQTSRQNTEHSLLTGRMCGTYDKRYSHPSGSEAIRRHTRGLVRKLKAADFVAKVATHALRWGTHDDVCMYLATDYL